MVFWNGRDSVTRGEMRWCRIRVDCVFAAFAVAAMLGSTPCLAADEAVQFADPRLRAAVRHALKAGDRPLDSHTLGELSQLIVRDRSISSLRGLEHCTALKHLELWSTGVSDLRPLGGLTQLEVLSLSSNQITDITPLSRLTRLHSLNLSCNAIADLEPLTNLTELRTLGLSSNEISDLEPLRHVGKLSKLDLGNNRIEDISPLADLTGLEELDVQANDITDLRPLTDLHQLRVINVESNPIETLEPLIDSPGIGAGDTLHLIPWVLEMQQPHIKEDIRILRERGVQVHDAPSFLDMVRLWLPALLGCVLLVGLLIVGGYFGWRRLTRVRLAEEGTL